MRMHRKLETWNLARKYVSRVYDVTDEFPATETYGLVSQLCRAAVSVASNIAEGYGKRTTKNYVKHLYDARASLREIDSHLIISFDLGFLTSKQLEQLSEELDELAAKLQAQINSLENRIYDD